MRFVLLYHRGDTPHFDFMLEHDDHLDTWRISRTAFAALVTGFSSCSLRIEPHRIAYLDFEGSLSCDRGSVKVYDSGEFRGTITGSGICILNLEGSRLRGRLTIQSIESTRPGMVLENTSGVVRSIQSLVDIVKICCNRPLDH